MIYAASRDAAVVACATFGTMDRFLRPAAQVLGGTVVLIPYARLSLACRRAPQQPEGPGSTGRSASQRSGQSAEHKALDPSCRCARAALRVNKACPVCKREVTAEAAAAAGRAAIAQAVVA